MLVLTFFKYDFYSFLKNAIYIHRKLPITGQTGHTKIGCKLKGGKWNLADQTSSKGININTNLIKYVLKTLLEKEISTVVNSINHFPLDNQSHHSIHTTIQGNP